jgi:predicted ArsR family transcriptional regulator
MSGNPQDAVAIEDAAVGLDRDVFLRDLLRVLSGSLQDIIGLEEASGFISLVGREIGQKLGDRYRQALSLERLTRPQIAEVLVDLKRRIEGDFYVIEESDEKIVFGNRACPFGDPVADRPALCMMTSNVFGTIAAENVGYAKVSLEETIAEGAPGCRIVVYLEPTPASERADGREYFRHQE